MTQPLFPLPITRIVDETPEAYTLHLQAPDDSAFGYLPGQYLTVEVSIHGEAHRRAFSLSSSPQVDEGLHLTIKRVPGGLVSNYLRDELQVGDALNVLPPAGNFTVELAADQARHYLLMGAGSGISPLMSMLKSVLVAEPLSQVTLWYGNRDEERIIFREELNQWQANYPERLKVLHFLSQPRDSWQGISGRLDEAQVYQHVLELFMVDEFQKRYFLCGPEGMMEAAQRALDRHAVHPAHVLREHYLAPLTSTPEAAHDVSRKAGPSPNGSTTKPRWSRQQVSIELAGETHAIEVPEDQTVLQALLDQGLHPPYACRSGICTSCMARLEQGDVHMDTALGLRAEDKERGYVLTCQAHPLTEDVRLVFPGI